jgi:hypothetical protein
MNSLRLVSGIFCVAVVAVVACGGASTASNASDAMTPDAASLDGTSTGETPDGGWDNGCSPALPIRWYVNNTNHTNPAPLHDACETLPAQCASDAGTTNPRSIDSKITCDCVVAAKDTKNDAGHTSCPGNGPIYCDVRKDGSLVFRCSPP